MKSSRNPTLNTNGQVTSWVPSTLTAASHAADQEEVERIQHILDFFNGPSTESSVRSRSRKSNTAIIVNGNSIQKWSPGQLETPRQKSTAAFNMGTLPVFDAVINPHQDEDELDENAGNWDSNTANPRHEEARPSSKPVEVPINLRDQLRKQLLDELQSEIEAAKDEAEQIKAQAEAERQKIMSECDQLVAQTRQQADALLEETQTSVDTLRKEAYDQGVQTAQQEMLSGLQAVDAIILQTTAWKEEILAQSENTVIELIKDVARMLFSDGFALDQDVLQQTLNRAMASSRTLGDLRIYLNPDDVRILDPSWREFHGSVSGQRIQMIPTEAIRRGGCYVEGQSGSVDARVETQLTALLQSLSNAQTDQMEGEA